MDEVIDQLQAVGFGEHEARAYVALLRHGPMTGYQLARASGIARPNIYPVLDRLERRGAITRVELEDGRQYTALPASEMLSRLSRTMLGRIEEAEQALRRLAIPEPVPYLWNIEGYDALLQRAEAMLEQAEHQAMLGLWSPESQRLGAGLQRAEARGLRPVVLCVQGCAHECGACRGDIYRYQLAQDAQTRWLIVVADGRELLIGQVFADGGARGGHTTLEVFVQVTSHFLRNAIAAAEIVRCLGPELPSLVDSDALRALQGAGLASGGVSWLEQLSHAVLSRTAEGDQPNGQ